jgi:uncharacterized membrane protein YfcA
VGSIGYVNLIATAAITSTSIVTAQWGVAAAHLLNTKVLRTIFGLYLLFVSYAMVRIGLG